MVDFVIDNIILKNEQSIFFIIIIFEKKLTEKAIFILPNPCLFLELDCSSGGVTHPTIAQGQPSIQTGSLSSKTEVKATRTNSVSIPTSRRIQTLNRRPRVAIVCLRLLE